MAPAKNEEEPRVKGPGALRLWGFVGACQPTLIVGMFALGSVSERGSRQEHREREEHGANAEDSADADEFHDGSFVECEMPDGYSATPTHQLCSTGDSERP